MPHIDEVNKHEEGQAMDDGITQGRSFRDVSLLIPLAIILCSLACYILYLIIEQL